MESESQGLCPANVNNSEGLQGLRPLARGIAVMDSGRLGRGRVDCSFQKVFCERMKRVFMGDLGFSELVIVEMVSASNSMRVVCL